MIHHAERVMVCIGGNVEHVFDPVAAIGDLHVHPVRFVVFHPTVPINVETKDFFVELIFGGAIANHEARVNEVKIAWWRRIRRIAWLGNSNAKGLNKADAMPLGIDD